jgi:hypothetical protein
VSTKLLFLDIDGVLNGHEWVSEAQSCDIRRDCVLRLNRILWETGAEIVLSSAWRYMIHGGAMTLSGFSYMMRTHGLIAQAKIVGLTCTDEEIPDRGGQIARWLEQHGRPVRYVVLDDDDFDVISSKQDRYNHPFVKTNGNVGLADNDADRVIELLREVSMVTSEQGV